MNSPAFLVTVLGLCFGTAGSFVMVIPQINRKKSVEKLSGTYAESNPYLAKALAEQTLLAIFGAVLLMIGFLLQLFALVLSG